MLHTVLALLAFGITFPPVPGILGNATRSMMCPATTERGQAVVTNFVSADRHESLRVRDRIPRSAPNQVRSLGTPDAEACASLMAALERDAARWGFPFRSSGVEFYQVGEFYFGSRPLGRGSCKPGPDHACIDTRWQPLHIFDRDLKLVRTVGL